MNQNQTSIAGQWKQFKGALVENVGKILGNRKMVADGAAEKTRGRIQAGASKRLSQFSKEKRSVINTEDGAVGYILAWILGVPASVLLIIMLLRG